MTNPSELDIDQQLIAHINGNRYTGYWSLCFDKPCDELWFNTIKLFKDGELTDVSTITCTLQLVDPNSESNVTHWVMRFYCKPHVTIKSIVSILENICITINYTDSHRFIVYDDPVNHTRIWRKWNPISVKTISNFNNCDCRIVRDKNRIIPIKT